MNSARSKIRTYTAEKLRPICSDIRFASLGNENLADTTIVISTLEEERRIIGQGPKRYEVNTILSIEIVKFEEEDILDEMDQIAGKIEESIQADPTLGGIAIDANCIKIICKADNSAEKRQGNLLMSFEVIYEMVAWRYEEPSLSIGEVVFD